MTNDDVADAHLINVYVFYEGGTWYAEWWIGLENYDYVDMPDAHDAESAVRIAESMFDEGIATVTLLGEPYTDESEEK